MKSTRPLQHANMNGVRAHNEQLILQAVRKHDGLTKSECSQLTGLSTNATSVIFKALEQSKHIVRAEKLTGRIGQPSYRYRINPDASQRIALHVGRRCAELACIDFAGQIVTSVACNHQFPLPEAIIEFVQDNLGAVQSSKAATTLHVAMPSELWSWADAFDAPGEALSVWNGFDLCEALQSVATFDGVVVENDATAACRAEHLFAPYSEETNWIYFFIGTLIGGGIVLDNRIYSGAGGNAGSFGPMRVPSNYVGDRLLDHASLSVLDRMMQSAGYEAHTLYRSDEVWLLAEDLVSEWIHRASAALAHAVVSSLSLLDFEKVVIDGCLPASIRDRLVQATQEQLAVSDLQGLEQPTVVNGSLGRHARIVGAAAFDW